MEDNMENITKTILSMEGKFTLTEVIKKLEYYGIKEISPIVIQRMLYSYQDLGFIEARGYIYKLKI